MAYDAKYESYNILDLIEIAGENDVKRILSNFSCPKNADVMHFLKNNAIEFSKKSQSMTYLVFEIEEYYFVGYFSIAIKPISIRSDSVSNSMAKRIARISSLDEQSSTYSVAAYLIAQLGKNIAIPLDKRIDGKLLLDIAMNEISILQHRVGGTIQFLECEDNSFLLKFYTKNGFQRFGGREAEKSDGSTFYLHQLLRKID